jgi:hypothetical protein
VGRKDDRVFMPDESFLHVIIPLLIAELAFRCGD